MVDASPHPCTQTAVRGPTRQRGLNEASIDFDQSMVFITSVPERPDAEFDYAIRSNKCIVIGLHALAYCGGAAPPSSVFLVELPRSEDEVSHDVCYTGDCGAGPFPP